MLSFFFFVESFTLPEKSGGKINSILKKKIDLKKRKEAEDLLCVAKYLFPPKHSLWHWSPILFL